MLGELRPATTEVINVDPFFADMVVVCPIPGKADGEQMRFGDFINTEQGREYGTEAIAGIEELMGDGYDREKATKLIMRGAIVRDEAGEIVRRPSEEQSLLQSQISQAEKK